MIHNMIGGGSGSGGSEFTVVTGVARPPKAGENTVWVNTDVEATKYVFSASEPTSPVAGMVWIEIGNTGSTKASALIDGNYFTLYLKKAEQYVGGKWVEKDSAIYQGGVWLVIGDALILLDSTSGLASNYSLNVQTNGTATLSGNQIALIGNDNLDKAFISPVIDCSKYSKMTVTGKKTGAGSAASHFKVGLVTTLPTADALADFAASIAINSVNVEETHSVDLSNMGSKYYVFIESFYLCPGAVTSIVFE